MLQSASPAQASMPVEFLFSMTALLLPMQLIPGGPQGTRAIIGVTGGTFEGPRLRGTFQAPSGEWATVRPDGSVKGDVRFLMKTDDGALIVMAYQGIAIPQPDGTVSIRIAPLFETGDERYTWLNTIQAVGKGTAATDPAALKSVSYDIYTLL